MVRRMQPIVAIRAVRQLIANPDDTDKVFEVIRAMAGDSVGRNYRKMLRTEQGTEILAREKSLLDTLLDKDKLRAMTANSLGQHYLRFMERAAITADGLVEASESQGDDAYEDPEVATFGLRLRDQHDLWHVVTGYGSDVAGEDCLLAFTYAQTKNRGLGFIGLIGALHLSKTVGTSIFKSTWQAYRAGKRAAWFPEQDWEELLALPLAEVRKLLNVKPCKAYLNIPGTIASAAWVST